MAFGGFIYRLYDCKKGAKISTKKLLQCTIVKTRQDFFCMGGVVSYFLKVR